MKSLLKLSLNVGYLSIPIQTLLAQEPTAYTRTGNAPGPVFWIIYAAVLLFMLIAMWKVFTKAGQPGWAILIPFYNLYVLCKIAGRPGWWLILCLIPFVNFIIFIILDIDIAKNFGKSAAFGIGLLLLPIIFFPILGFGSARYEGAAPVAV